MRHQERTTREAGDIAQQALDDMDQQMNNYQSYYDYEAYGPRDHYTVAGFNHKIDCVRCHAPKNYYRSFSQDLITAYDKGYISLSGNDVWICIDDVWQYGYGGTSDHNPWRLDASDGSSYYVWLGRAVDVEGFYTSSYGNDPPEITGIFTIHEAGHCYDAKHFDGDYIVKDEERYNVTPMATAYACNNRDTCFEAKNNPPNQLCYKQNNPCDGVSWCDPCSNLCRHVPSMTGGNDCQGGATRSTKETIYKETPL